MDALEERYTHQVAQSTVPQVTLPIEVREEILRRNYKTKATQPKYTDHGIYTTGKAAGLEGSL